VQVLSKLGWVKLTNMEHPEDSYYSRFQNMQITDGFISLIEKADMR
jgi:hypothetical protein